MEDLLEYILSTFNFYINLDARQYSRNSKLKLLDKSKYSIYITPILYPEIKINRTEYYYFIAKAIQEWSNALYKKILFEIVEVPSDADIIVYWTKSTNKYAGMQYQQNNKLCISIGIVDRNGYPHDSKYVYSTILHEFGHILGLGHSPSIEDIMYKNVNTGIEFLSDQDKFVLNLIYTIGNNKTYSEAKYIIDELIAKKNQSTLIEETKRNLCEDLDLISNINKRNIFLQNKNKK